MQLLLLLTAFILTYVDSYFTYSTFAVINIGILFVLLSLVMIRAPSLIAALLAYWVLRFTEIISVVVIEQGAYLTETGIFGSQYASASKLAFVYSFFLIVLYLSYQKIPTLPSIKYSKESVVLTVFAKASLLISLIVLLLGVLSGIQDGFALLKGINRFAFRSESNSLLLEQFLNNKTFCMYLLGSVLASTKERKIKFVSITLFLSFLLVSFFHGEQFTTAVFMTLSFMSTYLIIKNLTGLQTLKLSTIFGGVAIVLASIAVLIIYSRQGYDLTQIVVDRFALQGQLWFVVHSDSYLPEWGYFDSFINEITSYLSFNPIRYHGWIPLGMRELMYFYALPNIFLVYSDNGVTFTMGQMAVPLYWFGDKLIFVFITFVAIYLSFIVKQFVSLVKSYDLIGLFIMSKIFVWVQFGLQQGDYWYLFSAKTILALIILLIWRRFYIMLLRNKRVAI